MAGQGQLRFYEGSNCSPTRHGRELVIDIDWVY